MSGFLVTLNAEAIPGSRRGEAEEIVRSYFPHSQVIGFDYTGSASPFAILKFPTGAFGSLSEWSDALASHPSNPKDAGEVVKPHVEAELAEMLATKRATRPDATAPTAMVKRQRWLWNH